MTAECVVTAAPASRNIGVRGYGFRARAKQGRVLE